MLITYITKVLQVMSNTQEKFQINENLDEFDSFYECITACYGLAGEDIECVTECVSVHLKNESDIKN